MEAAAETRAPWRITGAGHGGITGTSVTRSLEFYSGLLGLDLVWRGELPAFHQRPPHVAA